MTRPTDRSLLSWALLAAVLALYALTLAQPLNLTCADLGRHLKNGELWLQQHHHQPLFTNTYSYTEPDFPTITHHWGSGVLFLLCWQLVGFTGLHLAFLAVSLLTLALVWRRAAQRAGAGVAAILFLALLPLLVERREIRPELFSYCFTAVFLHQLWRCRDGGGPARSLWLLPLLEIAWVNTHIYFVLGPAIIGAFWLESLACRQQQAVRAPLLRLLLATIAATLLNPFGWRGAAAPLTIFHEYGYRVLENQSVWFLERLMTNPNFLVYKVMVIALATTFLLAWTVGRQRLITAESLLAIGLAVMAGRAIRNCALFGLVALPVLTENLGAVYGSTLARHRRLLDAAGLAVLLAVLVMVWSGARTPLSRLLPPHPRGVGLAAGNNRLADFIKREQVHGPILNNYDIGGYLIWHLYPRQRVFVDNRPEAYSARFFEQVYVPLQENEDAWRRVDDQYRFNAICFYRLDATPWAQHFLIERVQDAAWAPVFVDDNTVLFLRRQGPDQPVIDHDELPREMFRVGR